MRLTAHPGGIGRGTQGHGLQTALVAEALATKNRRWSGKACRMQGRWHRSEAATPPGKKGSAQLADGRFTAEAQANCKEGTALGSPAG